MYLMLNKNIPKFLFKMSIHLYPSTILEEEGIVIDDFTLRRLVVRRIYSLSVIGRSFVVKERAQ